MEEQTLRGGFSGAPALPVAACAEPGGVARFEREHKMHLADLVERRVHQRCDLKTLGECSYFCVGLTEFLDLAA